MTRLPSLTGEGIIKALGRAGFQILRQRGNHVHPVRHANGVNLKHPDGRTTVVPIQKGESVGRGLMRKIMRDTDLSREEFQKLL